MFRGVHKADAVAGILQKSRTGILTPGRGRNII